MKLSHRLTCTLALLSLMLTVLHSCKKEEILTVVDSGGRFTYKATSAENNGSTLKKIGSRGQKQRKTTSYSSNNPLNTCSGFIDYQYAFSSAGISSITLENFKELVREKFLFKLDFFEPGIFEFSNQGNHPLQYWNAPSFGYTNYEFYLREAFSQASYEMGLDLYISGEIRMFPYGAVCPPADTTLPTLPVDPGGGGSGGGGNAGDTTVHLTDTCIQRALTIALAKQVKTKIKGLMTNTFLSNSTINLIFEDFPFSNSNVAEAMTGYASTTNTADIQISFNSNKMPYRSDQMNVATIYHEILHGYFQILFGQPNAGGITIVPIEHEIMATDYVWMLADDLQAIFLTLSRDDAEALAWGGLEKTSYYQFKAGLDPNWAAKVHNINLAYSVKGLSSSKGTYCK